MLTLYGSTVSGFALKDSDVNMTITEYESPKVLLSLFDVLKTDESGKGLVLTQKLLLDVVLCIVHRLLAFRQDDAL